MTRPPLVATRRRVVWAALYGVAAPPVMFFAGAFVRDLDARPSWASIANYADSMSLIVLIFFGFSALVMGLFGAPLWIALDRHKVRRVGAALAGVTLGAVLMTAVTLFAGLLNGMVGSLYRNWPLILSAGGIGGLTALGIWLIAYRPAPTPTAVAEAFA